MICVSVIPCSSSGLAKNNKIMSIIVLFSQLFNHFESLAFFENGGGGQPYIKAVKQDVLVNFSKARQLTDNFSKMRCYFD